MRTHRTPRRALFTPRRVASGPGQDIKLEKSRITTGTFVTSGEQFKIEDQCREPREAHLMLENAWIGTLEFLGINYKGNNNVSFMWAHWASEEESDAKVLIKKVEYVREKG